MVMQKISILTVLFAAVLWGGAVAQSSSCNSALTMLAPCSDFMSGTSTTPVKVCCTNLDSVVKSEPECLCEVYNGNSIRNFNMTRAMELPTACNLTISSTLCNAPSGSPTTPGSDGNNIKMEFSLLFFSVFFALFGSNIIAV